MIDYFATFQKFIICFRNKATGSKENISKRVICANESLHKQVELVTVIWTFRKTLVINLRKISIGICRKLANKNQFQGLHCFNQLVFMYVLDESFIVHLMHNKNAICTLLWPVVKKRKCQFFICMSPPVKNMAETAAKVYWWKNKCFSKKTY